MNRKNKLLLFFFFLIVFMDMLWVGLIIPILPIMFYNNNFFSDWVSDIIINFLLGLLIATYPLCSFFSAPVLWRYSDIYWRKKILIISLIWSFIWYIIFAIGILLNSVYMLFLGSIIDWLTWWNISIVNASIADVSNKKNKTKNFGLIWMAFWLWFMFWPFLWWILSDNNILPWFNFSTPFWVASFIIFINILLVSFMFKETLKQKSNEKIDFLSSIKGIKKIFSLKRLNIIFLVIFLINAGWSFFAQFFQIFLYNTFSFTSSQIGYLFWYMGLFIVISQWFIIRPISDKFKTENILKFAILWVSLVLLWLLFINKGYMLYFVMPILAIFFGFINPNFSTLISNSVSFSEQWEVLWLRQSVISLSEVISPIFAWIFLTLSKSMPIMIWSILIFLSWIIFFIFYKTNKEDFELS